MVTIVYFKFIKKLLYYYYKNCMLFFFLLTYVSFKTHNKKRGTEVLHDLSFFVSNFKCISSLEDSCRDFSR